MDFFNQFGVTPTLLLAQIFNFLILLFILNRFLFKPIIKVLDSRRQKIADSLTNAEKIQSRLLEIESERDKKIRTALDEAKQIVSDAKQSSSQIIKDAQALATQESLKIIDSTKAQLSSEREALHQEIRLEVSEIVVSSLEKIINQHLSTSDKKSITQEVITNLK